MTESPLVSIVIPAYNAKETICRSIDSILEQLDISIELIVVDDGSTDGTQELVASAYAQDARVHLIEVEHAGVSNARNVGIDAARGDWIGFCDADDLVPPGALSALLNCNAASPLIAGSMSFDTVGSDGSVLRSKVKAVSAPLVIPACDFAEEFEHLWTCNFVQSCCSKLFKADFLHSNYLRFDDKLSSYEDLDFVLKCLACSPSFAATDYVCYRYMRKASDTNSSRYKPDMADQMEAVAERVLRFYEADLKMDGCPECFTHITQLLVVAVNNAQKSGKANREMSLTLSDIFKRPVFNRAAKHAFFAPNFYSCLVCIAGRNGLNRIVRMLAFCRNALRSRYVA